MISVPLFKGGMGETGLAYAITRMWRARSDNYSEQRASAQPIVRELRVEMSFIGG